MMKYSVILTFTTGSVSGGTIRADNLEQAWKKALETFPLRNLQEIKIADIVSPDYEIK